MYLWVLIATFMVALLSYNLSVRPDVDRSYMETKAQTDVARFRVQHNAFKLYIDSLKIKEGEERTTVNYVSGLGYNDGTFTIYGEDANSEDRVIEFKKHLPFGYNPQEGIYSKVYCTRKDENGEIALCTPDDCCAEEDVAVYVVSWRALPSRWVNKIGIPTSDMMAVVAKTDGYGDRFGYVKEINGQEVISGGVGEETVEKPDAPGVYVNQIIYRPIFDAVLDDSDYQGTCKNGHVCLIAMDQVPNRQKTVDESINNNDEEENEDEGEF